MNSSDIRPTAGAGLGGGGRPVSVEPGGPLIWGPFSSTMRWQLLGYYPKTLFGEVNFTGALTVANLLFYYLSLEKHRWQIYMLNVC